MRNLNQMPINTELSDKVNEFAISVCLSPKNFSDLRTDQLQDVLKLYDKIRIKDGLEQALDTFTEGIYKLCVSTDDLKVQILDIIVEAKDLASRQILQELFWLMNFLGDDSTHRLLILRNLLLQGQDSFDKNLERIKIAF